MRRKFALSRSLHVEYKAIDLDPPYQRLLDEGRGAWLGFGRGCHPYDDSERRLGDCHAESHAILRSLRGLKDMGMAALFPNLRTLAIASIYGTQNATWSDFRQTLERERDWPGGDAVEACADLFGSLLAASRVEHVCVRNDEGPLRLYSETPRLACRPGKNQYTKTVHFDSNPGPLYFPHAEPRPIRWISDIGPSEDWMEPFQRMVTRVAELAQRHLAALEMDRISNYGIARVDIYFSTAFIAPGWHGEMFDMLGVDQPVGVALGGQDVDGEDDGSEGWVVSAAEQRRVTEKMGQSFQKLFRDMSRLKDEVRWHLSSETPTCEACGSGVPI